MADSSPPAKGEVQRLESSVRGQAKTALRRGRIELVLPRRQEVAAWRHARIRRFHLPAEIEATASAGGPDTFVVDLHRVVNRVRFRYGSGTWHPYVAALQEQLDGFEGDFEDSVLVRFYERFRPSTVHDALLGDGIPRGVLAGWPAVDNLLEVWSVTERHVGEVKARMARSDTPWTSQYLGPTPLLHSREHLERIEEAYTSIRTTGYRPSAYADGVVTGYFLVDGDDYRFVVGDGNHRLAALTLVDVNRIPVRLRLPHPPVVARDNLDRWTVEGGGLYSAEEASALFDSFFTDDGLERARLLGLS
ncbi:hypothetical protein BH23ACT9_BH23ACT9_29040 [soil metagenome]